MKKCNRWVIGVVALSFPFSPASLFSARADSYHSVESGETLSAIATKYRLQTEALRTLNKLQNADDEVLPSMLLRIPEASENGELAGIASKNSVSNARSRRVTTNASASFAPRAPISDSSSSGRGIITKSFLYTVQSGDTIESIAARHSSAGYPVTAKAIRSKNSGNENPVVGSTLIIPVQSQTYVAPLAASASTQSAPSRAFNDSIRSFAASNGDTALPKFQALPLVTTSDASPSSTRLANSNARRGPTSLGSRGYSPSSGMTRGGVRLDGARVVSPDEDVAVTGTPLSKLNPRSTTTTRAALNPTAQVARIAKVGARIRRLPQSDAVTLYSCATGTEIAVTQQSGNWSAILMSDRSTGWIPTRYLRFTGQNVDVSSQVVANVSTRDAELNYNGRWQSNNPMVTQALGWLGTRYVYGGEGRNGIDCSSLVQHAFAACGQRLPRTAAEQARVGTPIQPADLQAGDRLYFSASGTRVDHTGLYMGNGLFVHASGSGRRVMVSKLSERRNWNIFVGARR